MFDLTPQILLSPRDARIYNIARGILLVAFMLFVIFLITKVLFPQTYFTFDTTKPNALSNTMAPPETTRNGTIFATVTPGIFDRATITITFKSDTPARIPHKVMLKKGYYSAFYKETPIAANTPIDTHLSSGTLFYHRNGIWVVDDTTIRPIADERTFLAKGWSFDDVHKIDKKYIAPYKKGRLFTLKDPHPRGTIFRIHNTIHNTNRLFLITNHMRKRITPQERTLHFQNQPVITINDANYTTVATCMLTPSIMPWRARTAHCTIDLTKSATLPGTEYVIAIDNVAPIDIALIDVTLARQFTRANAITSLKLIAQRLSARYNQ